VPWNAGASTGGFTDCLLGAGAAHVYAVDVGRGQLDWRLRQDPRVSVFERTDIRVVTPELIGGPVDVAVADLSFISVLRAVPALLACTTDYRRRRRAREAQFESRSWERRQGGIVRDPEVHTRVLHTVRDRAADQGLVMLDVVPSRSAAPAGNIEFLAYLRKAGNTVSDATLDEVVHTAGAAA